MVATATTVAWAAWAGWTSSPAPTTHQEGRPPWSRPSRVRPVARPPRRLARSGGEAVAVGVVAVDAAADLAAEAAGADVGLHEGAARYLSPRERRSSLSTARRTSRPTRSAISSGPSGWFSPSFTEVTDSAEVFVASTVSGRTRVSRRVNRSRFTPMSSTTASMTMSASRTASDRWTDPRTLRRASSAAARSSLPRATPARRSVATRVRPWRSAGSSASHRPTSIPAAAAT